MATQIATRENDNPLVALRAQLEQRADEFRMVLPSHITPEKLQRTILTAVQLNPDLLNGDRRSFLTACFKAAQDGLLPDGREAALVVYNTRQKIDGQWMSVKQVNYLPMVWGLRKKILQSDEIADLFASVVYKQEITEGRFIYEEGTERMLRHKPILEPDFAPTDDDIAVVYSVATFKDGSKSFEVMRRSEVDRIRQLSQTGATGKTDRQGNPIQPKGPWVDFYSEMAKKTVIRRHSKSLPMSGDIFADVEAAEIDAAARSAVAALSLAPGGRPQAIEDRSEEETPHDPETGEVIEETEEERSQAEQKPAPPAARAKPKAAAPAEPEPQPEAAEPQEPTLAEESGLDPVAEGPHPAKAIADAIIAEINDPATNAILDVGAILNRNQLDMAAMPDELAVSIEIAADKKRAAIRAEQQKAKSREPAE